MGHCYDIELMASGLLDTVDRKYIFVVNIASECFSYKITVLLSQSSDSQYCNVETLIQTFLFVFSFFLLVLPLLFCHVNRKYKPLHMQSMTFPDLYYAGRFSPFECPPPPRFDRKTDMEETKTRFVHMWLANSLTNTDCYVLQTA